MANDYREKFEREIKIIKDLHTNGQRNQWEIGRHYNFIVDNRLIEEIGEQTAMEHMQAQLPDLSPATLKRYGAIARHFTQNDTAAHGTSKLTDLLTYLGLCGIHPEATPPAQVVVKVPQEGGAVVEKPFPNCSHSELTAAIVALKPPTEHLSERDAHRIQKYQGSLSEQVAAHVTLKVHTHRGTPLVNLANVPLDLLPELARALLATAGELAKEESETAKARTAVSPADPGAQGQEVSAPRAVVG